jgi:dimeric dUTPase (all-alpha-NTP-PPase superfamily)
MKTIKYLIALVIFVTVNHVQAKPADVKTAINTVFKSYLDIKNALAADNSKAANDAAKSFTAALKEVPADQMDAKQKATWQKYSEKLRYDGDHISESEAIAHQREHFGNLSANMYAVLKAFKDNDITLYQQYCPMAKKTWLSESSTIKNPYLGKEMPNCGVTKESFKPSK